MAFVAALPAPVIAIGLIWWSKGGLVWLDVTRTRPSLFPAIFPTLGLFAAVIGWMHVISGTGPLVVLTGVVTAVALAVAFFRRRAADKGDNLGVVGVLAAVLSFGLIFVANAALDDAPARIHSAWVERTYVVHHRKGGDSYRVVLGPWSDQPSSDLSMGKALYFGTVPGDAVCIFDRPGALHARWYYLDKCPANVPAPTTAP